MQISQILVILIVANEILSSASGIKWLTIATLSSTSAAAAGRGAAEGGGGGHGMVMLRREEECERLDGLVRRQKQVCKKNLELMGSVREGAIEALAECQYQFKDRRWNCSTPSIHQVATTKDGTRGAGKKDVFGKLGNSGTRETAFIHAITSAGVAYVVTKTCSSGTLDKCGCDGSVTGAGASGSTGAAGGGGTSAGSRPRSSSSTRADFEWAGCSDNIAFGIAFSRAFVDSRERVKGQSSSRALMNLQNNDAGRKAIEEKMWTQCKCHGVSGSCELKTCWRSLPKFRGVATTLRERYDSATEVVEVSSGSRRDLVPRHSQQSARSVRDTELVFLEASPDFCEPDARTGSLGTHGRLCSRGSNATDGCDTMCCGRGHVTRRTTSVDRCNCKFHWCCYVKCQQCRVETVHDVCR